MQWKCWVWAVAVIGIAGPALAYQPGCGCNGQMAAGRPGYQGLGAEACCGPTGYSLTPGCCEDQRPCCNNAWAGYCAHRAKVEACWGRIGAPRPPRRAAACLEVASPPCNCEAGETRLQPTPATPPEPAMPVPQAAPEKSGRRTYYPLVQ